MVSTRSSSRRPPVLKSFSESDFERDAGQMSEDEEVERPKKRVKQDDDEDFFDSHFMGVRHGLSAESVQPFKPFSLASRVQNAVVGTNATWGHAKSRIARGKAKHCNSEGNIDLAILMSMPADVFCEVVKHLTPLDLLQMSRTSKDLRGLLLSRKLRYVWVTTFKSLGLPDCPPDMPEPQYASLVFERDCHVCGYDAVYRIDFGLRMRLCRECFSLNVLRGAKIVQALPRRLRKDNTIFTLVPFHQAFCGINCGEDASERNISRSADTLRQMSFFKPDLLRAAREYHSLSPNPVAQQKFVEGRVAAVAKINEHAFQLDSWFYDNLRATRSDRRSISDTRRTNIETKLFELGYTEAEVKNQAYDSHTYKWDCIMDQPRELTPRIWKQIQPKLESIIAQRHEDARNQLLQSRLRNRKSEVSNFYKQYLAQLTSPESDMALMPNLADLCELPVIADLINANDSQNEVTMEQWDAAVESFPALFEGHRQRLESKCASILLSARQELNSKNPTKDDVQAEDVATPDDVLLRRAATIFQSNCGMQRHAYGYSLPNYGFMDIVGHHHVTGCFHVNVGEWSSLHGREWSAGPLGCSPKILEVADVLLDNLGLPSSITMAHMKSLGRRLICKRCNIDARKNMSWIDLVTHFQEFIFPFHTPPSPQVVTDHDLKQPSLAAITDEHSADGAEDFAGGDHGLVYEEFV